MKAKTNLKAVEVSEEGSDKAYQYNSDQMSDIADLLYSARAALSVLSCLDPNRPDALQNGSVYKIAFDARERIVEVLDILDI